MGIDRKCLFVVLKEMRRKSKYNFECLEGLLRSVVFCFGKFVVLVIKVFWMVMLVFCLDIERERR